MKSVFSYFTTWDGWFCEVETDGETCGEVIGSDSRDMARHLKDKHNIEAEP